MPETGIDNCKICGLNDGNLSRYDYQAYPVSRIKPLYCRYCFINWRKFQSLGSEIGVLQIGKKTQKLRKCILCEKPESIRTCIECLIRNYHAGLNGYLHIECKEPLQCTKL